MRGGIRGGIHSSRVLSCTRVARTAKVRINVLGLCEGLACTLTMELGSRAPRTAPGAVLRLRLAQRFALDAPLPPSEPLLRLPSQCVAHLCVVFCAFAWMVQCQLLRCVRPPFHVASHSKATTRRLRCIHQRSPRP